MKTIEILTIVALIGGPILAVQIQVFLERRRRGYENRLGIFKTLMATRAIRLNQQHVQALNMIDLEFNGKGKTSRAVIEAWRAYLDGLSQPTNVEGWNQRQIDLLMVLLQAMAHALGYDFDRTAIKNGIYFPTGHARAEEEDYIVRQRLIEILTGKAAFPVSVITECSSQQPDKTSEATECPLSPPVPPMAPQPKPPPILS